MSKQPRYDDLSRTELFQGTYAKNYMHDPGLDIFGDLKELLTLQEQADGGSQY